MKNAAKCDMSCELQNSVNHRIFERKLRSWDSPRTTLPGVSVPTIRHLSFAPSWPKSESLVYTIILVRLVSWKSVKFPTSLFCLWTMSAREVDCVESRRVVCFGTILPLSWTWSVCFSPFSGRPPCVLDSGFERRRWCYRWSSDWCALSARQERPVSAYIATGHLYTKQREAEQC